MSWPFLYGRLFCLATLVILAPLPLLQRVSQRELPNQTMKLSGFSQSFLFSTGHALSIYSPSRPVLVSSAYIVASAAVPSRFLRDIALSSGSSVAASFVVAPNAAHYDDAPVAASCNVASNSTSCNVALISAGFDVARPIATTTILSTLPPPVPLLLNVLTLPLAFSASAPPLFNTLSLVVVLGATVPHRRSRLARRTAEYADLENNFLSRKVGIKIHGWDAIFYWAGHGLCHRGAHRQLLLDSRGNQITSLQPELVKVRAHLLVSADALAGKTHKCNQLRHSVERLRIDYEGFQMLFGSFSQHIKLLGRSLERASPDPEFKQCNLCCGFATLLEDNHLLGALELDSW